ncbi:MAG TPA: hypothetical protein VFY12_09645 [Arenimonas sp.]|nr:hypothetical protein [Arenimonas sp.]
MNRLPAFRLFAVLALIVASLVLVGCPASKRSARGPLDQALYDYAGAIRWSDFEAAYTFVDPEVRAEQDLAHIEIERLKQFQTSDYQVKRVIGSVDDVYEQVVEIRLVNRHTQLERTVVERQRWRFDAEQKAWWLMTGLPRIVQN